jgi:hypothetical protein
METRTSSQAPSPDLRGDRGCGAIRQQSCMMGAAEEQAVGRSPAPQLEGVRWPALTKDRDL